MKFSPDEHDDAEMDEEASGNIVYRSPSEGIAAMEARINRLQKRLDQIHPNAVGSEAEIALIRDIRTAKARLAEYKTQFEGRN